VLFAQQPLTNFEPVRSPGEQPMVKNAIGLKPLLNSGRN
jgi:hypothetical protein